MSIKTTNMSFWDMRIDFDKSHGSYLFDKNTNREYLDFFGMYSSLPLGYNHKVFDEEFHREMRSISTVKVANCEFHTDVYDRFCDKLNQFAGLGKYENYHFTCTGSLAVECACKLAMDYSGKDTIVSLANSFHGIHSYGNFATSKFYPVKDRLHGFPNLHWPKVHNVFELDFQITKGNVAGILVEPIQATFGDNHFSMGYLKSISKMAKDNDIPLIFDEIQTGFGTTGKPWYFEHLDIEPDIVVFGKKSQVSGIMSTPKIPFTNGSRLCVTFDGDILDMLRSTYIMKAYEEYDLLNNAIQQGKKLVNDLSSVDGLLNVRGIGLMIAFDMESKTIRDDFVDKLKNNGMICNPTGEKSVRLRPNLAVTDDDIQQCICTIRSST